MDTTCQLPISGRLYQHFKGGLYRCHGTATCSETQQRLVVYRSLTDGQLWVRPLSMFIELIEHEGMTMPRFTELRTNKFRHVVGSTFKRIVGCLLRVLAS